MLFTILTANLCFDTKNKEEQEKNHQMTSRLGYKIEKPHRPVDSYLSKRVIILCIILS